MKVQKLLALLAELPDDADVLYDDPNFTGPYHILPEVYNFKVEVDNNRLLIEFPFEEAVD